MLITHPTHSPVPATLKARLLEYVLEVAAAEASARDRRTGSDNDIGIAVPSGSTATATSAVYTSQPSVASAPQPRRIPSQSQMNSFASGSTTNATHAGFAGPIGVTSAPQPRSVHAQSQKGMWQWLDNGRVRMCACSSMKLKCETIVLTNQFTRTQIRLPC